MKIFVSIALLIAVIAGSYLIYNKQPENQKSPDGISSFDLANGLRVIVVVNHRSPVVVSQIWYKVGSSFEHDGITGVSHVLEHMMFKGTTNYQPGEFSEIIAVNGGLENAFTSKDYTAYFQRIASDRLEICLELEADRMQNLLFIEDEFLKELEVVKEERRLRTDDNPAALTYEQFNSIAYTNSPYRQPIIGWSEDLDSMTMDDVRNWYETWYKPNNATLVIAGDVGIHNVYQLVQKHFGSLKPSPVLQIKPKREIKSIGEKRTVVEVPAEIPTILIGYKVPVLKVTTELWEVYALEVLAGILDGGNSARLTSHLVRGSEIAASVGAGYNLYARSDTQFMLSAIPAENVTIEDLEKSLLLEIEMLKKFNVDEAELDRIKAQVVASSVYEQDSLFYQAMNIGILETNGLGWETKDEYIQKIKEVTKEQVREVTNKYFLNSRKTVAILKPLPLPDIKTGTENIKGDR